MLYPVLLFIPGLSVQLLALPADMSSPDYIPLKQEPTDSEHADPDVEELDASSPQSHSQRPFWRILLPAIVAAILGVGFSFLWLMDVHIGLGTKEAEFELPSWNSRIGPNVTNVLDYVKGPPTLSFKDNLKSEYQYVTGWNTAGMTNIVMAYVNLIYVAKLAGRIPIIPPLSPDVGHLGSDGKTKSPMLNFGEIFDLGRLRKELDMPILEWKDVKVAAYGVPYSHETTPVEGAALDQLGCWGLRGITMKGKPPARSLLESLLWLDTSYTSMPDNAVVDPNNYHVKAWSLVEAMFPQGRKKILGQNPVTHLAPTNHEWVAPDEQLGCFDDMYGISALNTYEWFLDYCPQWRFIGTHLHFTPRLNRITDEYLMQLFGVDTYDQVPPYIAIHIRRGDWDSFCFKTHPEIECWAPTPVWAKHVDMVKQQLKEKFGADSLYGLTTHVIVTSDEINSTWWDTEITPRGWLHVDFGAMNTTHVYNRWYPSLIDSVIQSRAIGLVGLQRSTMSVVAQWRVLDWNNGASSFVNWYTGHGERRGSASSDYD